MLTFKNLARRPAGFKAMTGLSVAEFERLLEAVRPHYEEWNRARLERPNRKRSPGGGLKSRHDLSQRLLMTMVWLRLYLTLEAVGVIFAVDKGTVSRFTRPILAILHHLGMDSLGWPQEARQLVDEAGPGEPPAPSPGAADSGQAGANPPAAGSGDALAIIDATEQRVQRAKGYRVQKAHYSGKRKTHTRKVQVVVNEQGRIRHLSHSVPGSTHDLTLLAQSGLGQQLPVGVTGLGDCGYRGLQNYLPLHSLALPYRPKDRERLSPEERYHNHELASTRVVVENTIARMKCFRVLADRFRHALDTYDWITHAVAGIVNGHLDYTSSVRASTA